MFAAVTDAFVDRRAKQIETFVKTVVQAFLRDELPVTLDQVQVRRITRTKNQLDAELPGEFLNEKAVLISRIVKNDLDLSPGMKKTDLPKKVANAQGIDANRIRHANHRKRNRIERPEHVVSLATARRTNTNPCLAPKITEKRTRHKMGGVPGIQHGVAAPSLCDDRLHRVFKKFPLRKRIGFRREASRLQTPDFFF